jgi:AraC-like DNA-binding protein
MFELYFANINTSKFVEKSKYYYEQEELRNNNINQELEENINSNNANNIIKRKMHSDMLLNNYKQNIINATNLFKEYPSGRLIGSCAVVKYNREIFFLITGYNKDYIRRRFVKACGMTPNEYLTSLRIEHAKKLLSQKKNTQIYVADIGVMCGYYDPNYFSRIFKKQTGITPEQYANKIMP